MSINLNKYKIEVVINTVEGEQKTIKLPLFKESFQKALTNILLADKDTFNYKFFNSEFMSVRKIKKIDNIKINIPTNVFYLNLYLNILKNKNIDFADEEMILTTDILKEKIVDLLELENKNYNYDELKKEAERKFTNENEDQDIDEVPDKIDVNDTRSSVETNDEISEDEPLTISIEKIRQVHRERKAEYERKRKK